MVQYKRKQKEVKREKQLYVNNYLKGNLLLPSWLARQRQRKILYNILANSLFPPYFENISSPYLNQ